MCIRPSVPVRDQAAAIRPGMQRQAAYILPKPTAGNNNLANLQVIFPNQIADSAKVSETGILASVVVVVWIQIQPLRICIRIYI